MTNASNSSDDAQHAIELQMVESLLRQALQPDEAAREERITRVLRALEQEDSPHELTPLPASTSVFTRRFRRWAIFAAAACLILAIGFWRQATNPSRQAYATVQRSLQGAEQADPRRYRFVSVVHRPLLGRREVEGDLYVDGAVRFALRHPALLPTGVVWIGGNERENWIVPAIGPVLVGDERMLQNWIAERKEFATPYLHIATMLQRLSNDFELQSLPDEAIPDLTSPGRIVVCRRVRGVLRTPSEDRRPRVIDLWADRDTGVARRLEIDWKLPPHQLGRSRLTLELVAHEPLPPDWFEHSAHGGGRATISP